MKTSSEILVEILSNLNNEIANSTSADFVKETENIVVPMFYSEDDKGNIIYWTESIKECFDSLMDALEKHNATTNFNWGDEDEDEN